MTSQYVNISKSYDDHRGGTHMRRRQRYKQWIPPSKENVSGNSKLPVKIRP